MTAEEDDSSFRPLDMGDMTGVFSVGLLFLGATAAVSATEMLSKGSLKWRREERRKRLATKYLWGKLLPRV